MEVEAAEWEHIVREEARLQAWSAAARRRPNLQGIVGGIDRMATCAGLEARWHSPYDKGILRSILSDSVWTGELAWKAKQIDSPLCGFCCEGAVEDVQHIWWECPFWEPVRQRHPKAVKHVTLDSPPCLRLCGIMPCMLQPVLGEEAQTNEIRKDKPKRHHSNREVVDLTAGEVIDLVLSDDSGDPARAWTPAVPQAKYNERARSGRIVVFTDGASRNNQYVDIRRAGFGAYWGTDHPFNVSCPLVGPRQTNQRAELMAAVAVLELELRACDVRTDSRYVIDGVLRHRRGRDSGHKGKPLSNEDLWARLGQLLDARLPGEVVFTKVKGHASASDVLSGRATAFDKHGNDEADELAVIGALTHAVHPQMREAVRWRVAVSKDVQQMMVAILKERAAQQPAARRPRRNSSSSSCSSSSSQSSNYTSSRSRSSSSSSSSSSRRGQRRRGRSAPAAAE